MTQEEERRLWVAVYAAVMQGLVANHECRLSWPELRDRAESEANIAIRKAREI